MKKILLGFCSLFIFMVTRAQVTVEDSSRLTPSRWRDSIFRMNLSVVPTGLLTDYSLSPFDAYRYDGVANNDDTIKNDGQLWTLHSILNKSKVNSTAQLIITDTLYARAFTCQRTTNTIPFTLVYQQYNRLKPTAISQNLLKLAPDSVGILDVAGRTQLPYDAFEFFAFAPFTGKITQFNAINFSFPSNLWQLNGITAISIDFGDGTGFRTITPNSTVSVYYAEEGAKLLTAQISTPAGIRTAKTQISYTRPAGGYTEPAYSWNVEADYVYQNENDYLGTTSLARPLGITPCGISVYEALFCGVKPSATVRIENGCGNVFDKPIIIVGGFATDSRTNVYSLMSMFNNYYFKTVLMSYGYDFVYVDFTNKNTFIENNAKVLEGVINKVNQTKTGTEKNILIGYSMGGLVARWCLKDMEDRGLQHNVSKYFSYDAPHQGANTPLGLQYLFDEIETDIPELKFDAAFYFLSNAAHSYAAKQMMVTSPSGTSGSTLNPLRAAFAARLKAKGYPQQCTNYGMALGRGDNTAGTKIAGNGAQWGFVPGTRLLQADMGWVVYNFTSSTYAVQQNGIKDYILRYRFNGMKTVRIFGIPVAGRYDIKIRNYKYTSANSYDEAPGSYATSQKEFVTNLKGNGAASAPTTDGHDGHNFISTVSALDLQNQNYSAANNWQSSALFTNVDNLIQNVSAVTGNTLSTPALSPFKYVMTATSNSTYAPSNWEHTGGLNYDFARFLTRKILNNDNDLPCDNGSFCSGYIPTITGNQLVCNEETYQVGYLPNLNYNWVLSNGNAQIISGQGTPAIRIKKLISGTVTITLTVTSTCGAGKTTAKVIHAGVPNSAKLLPSGETTTCLNVPANFAVDYEGERVCWPSENKAGITAYTWNIPAGNQVSTNGSMACPESIITNAGVTIRFSNFGPISVRAQNACGLSEFSAPVMITKGSWCSSLLSVNVYPNPAASTITVTASAEQLASSAGEQSLAHARTDASDKTAKPESQQAAIQRIKVYDVTGRLMKTFTFNGSASQVKLATGNWIAGVYFVEVYTANGVNRQKVIIRR